MQTWIRVRFHFFYRHTQKWSIVVASLVFISQVNCCMPTQPTRPPVTTTTPPVGPTTTSTAAPVCCGALNQTISNQFADGVFNFSYNDPDCRTQAVMNCINPVAAINLTAAIVLNNNTFLAQGFNRVTASADCNSNSQWTVTGNTSQSIVLVNLFCILADSSNPGGK